MTARPLSDDLYVLKFLEGETLTDEDAQACEYRLLCSGAFQSDKGNPRFLIAEPFEWVVASEIWHEPMPGAWPTETMMRFQVMPIHKTTGKGSHTYYPDDELAHDLAALLSLLSRRLITVAGCSSWRMVASVKNGVKSIREIPLPFASTMNVRHWPAQPHVFVDLGKPETIALDYNPRLRRISGKEFADLLRALPKLKAAKNLVLAARLYAQAMALIHQEPDMAYLLITMAIETVASQAINVAKTDEEIGKSASEAFKAILKGLGASDEQIVQAIIAAVPQHGRPTYQFRVFAEEFHTDELYSEDDLFRTGGHKNLMPSKDEVKKGAASIYTQRSSYVHQGKPYPASIGLGIAAKIDSRAFQFDYEKGLDVPPLAWAERLAHVCIVNYWRKEAQALNPEPPTEPSGPPKQQAIE